MNFKAIYSNVSHILRQLSWRVFALLLVVSCALWLAGKLSHRYTTEISIPIEFTADYKADVWVRTATQKVRFRVEGDGGNLLLYKMGLGRTISIPISALKMNKYSSRNPYLFTITEESLVRAISVAQTDFRIAIMTDTLPKALISPIKERKIPIVSRVHIDCVDQFMVVGGVHVVPDSVSIKAPLSMLDTIKLIYTKPLNIEKCSSSQSGAVDLELPESLVASHDVVRYEASVQRFTERQYHLPIEVTGAPIGSFIIPNTVKVTVQIPLTEYFGQQSPKASIDIRQREKYSKIHVSGLPLRAKIIRMEPEFAQFFTVE